MKRRILMRGVDKSGRNDFDHGHTMWAARLGGLKIPMRV